MSVEDPAFRLTVCSDILTTKCMLVEFSVIGKGFWLCELWNFS